MRKIFKDMQKQACFEKQGYICIPFKSAEAVKSWYSRVTSLSPQKGFQEKQTDLLGQPDFHCTFFDENQAYRWDVFNIISDLFNQPIQEHLDHYSIVQANIFIKHAKNNGMVSPHQNLTVVDESKFTSVSFWCPVVDTSVENGTMYLVPGSHKKFMKYRNTNISWPLGRLMLAEASKFWVPVNVNAGELLIIDDSIIHYTPNNLSKTERPVFHAILAPTEAEIRYHELDKELNTMNVYSVDRLFWQSYKAGTVPAGLRKINSMPYTDAELSVEEFEEELRRKT